MFNRVTMSTICIPPKLTFNVRLYVPQTDGRSNIAVWDNKNSDDSKAEVTTLRSTAKSTTAWYCVGKETTRSLTYLFYCYNALVTRSLLFCLFFFQDIVPHLLINNYWTLLRLVKHCRCLTSSNLLNGSEPSSIFVQHLSTCWTAYFNV